MKIKKIERFNLGEDVKNIEENMKRTMKIMLKNLETWQLNYLKFLIQKEKPEQ